MRVAELFWEPRRSGITGHVLGLARGLPRDRVDPFFIVPEHLADSRRELALTGARVFAVPLENKLFPRAALDRLPALLRREAPDVLHVHALEAGLWGHHARRAARVPRLVFTPHTDTIRRREAWPIYLALWRRYGRETDVLLASTEAQRERLVALGVAPRGRVLLGPSGVRVPERATARDEGSRRAARERLGFPVEGKLVGQVGRLVAQKDPLAVVRLAHELRGTDARVVLVGDGPLEAEARALARELDAPVHFAGFVADLDSVYAALDVLVLASRWEGLSVVLLEALARGLAVVAAANEGNAAVIRDGETGRVVAPGDVAALAGSVREVLADSAGAARLGDAARTLMLREYDERACAARIALAYESPPRPRRLLHAPAAARTVSVAIPTRGRADALLRCLDSVLAFEPAPLEVLVLDVSHEHEAHERLEALERSGKVRWLRRAPSLPGARNQALREARGEIVLFLDEDTEAPRDLVLLHARHFEDPTIAVTGGAVFEPGLPAEPRPFVTGITRSGRCLANRSYPHATDARGVASANCAVRRSVALELGGFEERLADHGDVLDLCQRVLARGGRVFHDPEARLVQRPAPGLPPGFEQSWRDFVHDDAFFFLRHVGPRWLPLFVARHVASAFLAALGRAPRDVPEVPRDLATFPRLLAASVEGFARATRSARLECGSHGRRGPLPPLRRPRSR